MGTSSSEAILNADTLFALARDRGARSRGELVQIIGDIFCGEENILGAQERLNGQS